MTPPKPKIDLEKRLSEAEKMIVAQAEQIAAQNAAISDLTEKHNQIGPWVEKTLETWKTNLNANIGEAIDLATAKITPQANGGMLETVVSKLIDAGSAYLRPQQQATGEISPLADKLVGMIFRKSVRDYERWLGEAEHVTVG